VLERLDRWKQRFGAPGTDGLEKLLDRVEGQRFRAAEQLIQLHETLLFLRAYPASREVARRADRILSSFAARLEPLRSDLTPFEGGEISGIDGSSLTAVFSYEVAARLKALHPGDIDIDWERYDEPDRLGSVLAEFIPALHEEWPVEAHVPYRDWLRVAKGGRGSDLEWLLARFEALPSEQRAERYDALQLPLCWRVRGKGSRSRLRLPRRSLYLHKTPLLRRTDVSLAAELQGPPLPVRRLEKDEAHSILDLILDTSAMRYRELYGFSHPESSAVFHADAGRGIDIYFFGVPAEWRLPLRAYHGGMFFKNGVPAGYVELLSFFERAEVGFNLYYTFREGESAYIYAALLRLFHQVLGVNCFYVDPYQIGHENPEAVESGAFWFYRKLGFRSVVPELAELTAREEAKMKRTPGYRSSKRTLERLAEGPVLYEGPGCEHAAWDRFRIRNLGLAAAGGRGDGGWETLLSLIPGYAGWPGEERAAAERIADAKRNASDAQYLRLMQRHARLRAAVIALGSA
jgi:hypothetical protein